MEEDPEILCVLVWPRSGIWATCEEWLQQFDPVSKAQTCKLEVWWLRHLASGAGLGCDLLEHYPRTWYSVPSGFTLASHFLLYNPWTVPWHYLMFSVNGQCLDSHWIIRKFIQPLIVTKFKAFIVCQAPCWVLRIQITNKKGETDWVIDLHTVW